MAAVYAVSREYFGQMPAAWVGELVKEVTLACNVQPHGNRVVAICVRHLCARAPERVFVRQKRACVCVCHKRAGVRVCHKTFVRD